MDTLIQNWYSDTWNLAQEERFTYTYDNLGYISYFLSEEWNGTNWIKGSRSFSFNDYFHNYSIFCEELYAYYYIVTGMQRNTSIIQGFSLNQNYPNPFNQTTTIKYSVGKYSNVRIIIYNTLGQLTEMLVDENKNPGNYSVQFDAHNLTSGIYYYKISSGQYEKIKKMLLVK
jgi:hypothetical protein